MQQSHLLSLAEAGRAARLRAAGLSFDKLSMIDHVSLLDEYMLGMGVLVVDGIFMMTRPSGLLTPTIGNVDSKTHGNAVQVLDPELRLPMLGKHICNGDLLVILQPDIIALSVLQGPVVLFGDIVEKGCQQVQVPAFHLSPLPIQPEDGGHGRGCDVDDDRGSRQAKAACWSVPAG